MRRPRSVGSSLLTANGRGPNLALSRPSALSTQTDRSQCILMCHTRLARLPNPYTAMRRTAGGDENPRISGGGLIPDHRRWCGWALFGPLRDNPTRAERSRPLRMRATPSWLIWKPFDRISSRIALSDLPWARSATISRIASCCASIEIARRQRPPRNQRRERHDRARRAVRNGPPD